MIFDGERRVDGPDAGQDRKRYGRILALLLGCLSLFACHRAFEPQAPSTPEPEATPAAQHDTLVTQAVKGTTTPIGIPSPEAVATDPQTTFTASRLVLAAYEPPQGAEEVVQTLARECEDWLNQEGDSAASLSAALRSLPKLDSTQLTVDTVDLNGDGRRDVLIEPQFLGLAVIGCVAREGEHHVCHPLPAPAAFGDTALTMDSGVLTPDLTGDGSPETVVTYTVQGGSGWSELVYAFQWADNTGPTIVLHATLINWAGRSTWQLQTDPGAPGRQQFLLTYPHLYGLGFDHKMLDHPVGRQVWRWDDGAGTFALSEQSVDRTRSVWGDDFEITTEDQLRWITNEGETAFRQGQYEAALSWFDEALALGSGGVVDPHGQGAGLGGLGALPSSPDPGLSRSRDAGSVRTCRHWSRTMKGTCSATWPRPSSRATATARATRRPPAYAAMRKLDDTLRDHLYYGRPGALRAPMTAEGILCCAPGSSVAVPDTPAWPMVGGFDD